MGFQNGSGGRNERRPPASGAMVVLMVRSPIWVKPRPAVMLVTMSPFGAERADFVPGPSRAAIITAVRFMASRSLAPVGRIASNSPIRRPMSISPRTPGSRLNMRVAAGWPAKCWTTSPPSSSRASRPTSSTGCATTTWSNAGGCDSRTAQLRAARLPPYPKSICASVNHQVCHGVPNNRPLKKGDIVNRHHDDQGRLARRHQPHVRRRRRRRSPPAACEVTLRSACGSASTR